MVYKEGNRIKMKGGRAGRWNAEREGKGRGNGGEGRGAA